MASPRTSVDEPMRAFIAIEVDPTLSDRLELELHRMSRAFPGARWVKRDSLHLSLAFLGEISDAAVPAVGAAMARVASKHSPFSLQVRSSGTFGPLECPKVLWVGLGGELEPLMALQREI